MEHQVVVTLGDVWEELKEQKIILNTILSRLEVMSQAADTQDKTLADHEKRVRDLERRVWALPGIATLIALGSLIYQIVRR